MTLYTISDQGEAEEQLCEAIAALEAALRPIRRLTLAGHGGALPAYGHARTARNEARAANRHLNSRRAA